LIDNDKDLAIPMQEWENYTNAMNIPAWIVNTHLWEIVFINRLSENFPGNLHSGLNLNDILPFREMDKLKNAISTIGFFVISVEIGEGEKRGHVEMIANKLRGDYAIIAFVLDAYQNGYMESAVSQHQIRADLAEEINQILKLEIGEHKKTQEKLIKAEEYASSIIGSSLNMIVSLDSDLNIKEFNRTAQQILGFSKDDVIGQPVKILFEQRDKLAQIIRKVNREGEFEGEISCLRKSGSGCDVFLSVSQLRSEGGQGMGYVCSMKDITDIIESRKQLAKTEEKYVDLFENASDLIQGLDPNGRILYVNKAWKEALGYNDSEVSVLCFFDLMSKESKDKFVSYFEGITKGRSTKTQIWVLIRKDGSEIQVESKENLKFEADRPHSVRSIMRDVTGAIEADRRAQEQQAKIEAIFDSGDIMFWTVNENTALTSFNKKYRDTIFWLYGVVPELNNDLNKPKKKFASDEYHGFWEGKYREVFETGKRVFFQTKTRDKDGKTYFREVYLSPIWDTRNKTKVKEVAGMGVDITEKKTAERRISEQSAKVSTIFNAANHMIWSVDTNFRFTSYNDFYEKKLAERFDAQIANGINAIDLNEQCSNGSGEIIEKYYSRVLKGEMVQFETVQVDKYKKEHVEEVFLSPIYNEEGVINEIAGIAQTVTFKRTAERKLKDQAAKINAIFDSTAMLIWTVDRNLRIVSYNKVFGIQHFKLLGHEVSIGSDFVSALGSSVNEEGLKELRKYFSDVFKGDKQQFEGVLYGKDGKKRWMETFLNPIYLEDDRVKEISCLSYEITEKKIIEEQMLESIHEKEILLQEVHHRVKNNLQVISSILNLQSSYVKDENSLNILRESQNRIKSMSFIHESLYQTRDFSRIEFSDYILSLSNNLIHSYSIDIGKIALKTKFEKVFLSLDQAIPCGLIVNELVSNALKYAFPQGTFGEITLTIRDSEKIIEIEIGDNGIGLPDGLEVSNSDSLGLQLVYTLIDQLDATIDVTSQDGTKYLITFEKQ